MPPLPASMPDSRKAGESPEWPDSPEPARLPDLPPVDRELSGYGRMVSIPLDEKITRWVPAGALFLAFVLTFFPWNGMYPAGYAAYTQNAWYGLFASLSRDAVADDELKIGNELEDRLHSSWWLLPYLLFLLPALALALAGPILSAAKIKLPANIEPIWRFRPAALGVLVIMMLLFLLAQWASGFGIQRAVNDKIEADWAERKAQANTPDKMQRWEMNVAKEKGGYHVRTTPWQRLSVFATLIAAIAVAAEAGLMLRGKKPAPRVGVMW